MTLTTTTIRLNFYVKQPNQLKGNNSQGENTLPISWGFVLREGSTKAFGLFPHRTGSHEGSQAMVGQGGRMHASLIG